VGIVTRFAIVSVVGISVLLAVLYDLSRRGDDVKGGPDGAGSSLPAPEIQRGTPLPKPPEPSGSSSGPARTEPATERPGGASAEPTVEPAGATPPEEVAARTGSESGTETPETPKTSAPPETLPAPRLDPKGCVLHRVKKGETLSGIARKHYSNVSYAGLLARLNRDRIADASRLQEGLLLRLPPVEHVHLVAKKETLWSILKKRYGRSPDAALIKRIKDENGIADENRIKAGMLLYLPD